MTHIKSFKDLGISNEEPRSFTGEKIAIKKILGKSVIIHSYHLSPSKFDGNRLDIQITYNEEKRVIFTSSIYLTATLEKIPKDSFPFTTIIQEQDERYIFT